MNRSLFVLLLFTTFTSIGQELDSLRFPLLHFNPYENFHYFEFNALESPKNQDGFDFSKYQYLVPFGIGIEKDIYQSNRYLLSTSASINVQFIFRNENNAVLEGIRKTLFNTDFILRLHMTFVLSDIDKIRLTLYHRSSHLGDDYVQTNRIDRTHYWEGDESNYEALQIQYAKDKRQILFYVGTQLVFRPDTPRKRHEFHQGLTIKNFSKHKHLSKVFIGYDIKLLENNNYDLDIDIGIGYVLSASSHIRINYFSGHIAFSRYERTIKNSWIGIGFYINASSI